jgi:membrane protein YdbS with pleckstrin-like domain
VRRFEVGAVTVLAAAGAGIVGALSSGWAGAIAAGAVLAAGVLVERFVRRRVRAWSYAEREDDLLVKRGVLFSRLSVVPYGRMQFIDVTAGLGEAQAAGL